MTSSPTPDIPIVCDMTGATDTPAERLEEYRRLFADGLVGRERTAEGIQFRFKDRPDLADWVEDLSRREHACCPFMFFEVVPQGDELWWNVSTVDDEVAKVALDGLYELPDAAVQNLDDLMAHYASLGLDVVATETGFEGSPGTGSSA